VQLFDWIADFSAISGEISAISSHDFTLNTRAAVIWEKVWDEVRFCSNK
jgi:hypothetical protein